MPDEVIEKSVIPPNPSTNIQQPKEPPKEILESNFSADDFTGVNDFEVEQLPEMSKSPSKVKETPKEEGEAVTLPVVDPNEIQGGTTEEKVEEVKKEESTKLPKFLKPPGQTEKGKVEVKATEALGKITPPDKSKYPANRDYSGFTQEETNALKKMNNEQFALLSKVIKESKEQKNSTYLQHDQAYVLDPTFQSLNQESQAAEFEAKHWEQQLIRMDKGESFIPMLGWDKNGQPVYGEEQEPSKLMEERVRQAMMQCNQVVNQKKGEIGAYPSKYKNQVTNDLTAINDERKKRFAWVEDPKLLDYSITIPGFGDRAIKDIRSDITNLFPNYMRSHPLAEVAGDFFVALMLSQAENAELKSGKQIAETIKEEGERVEPSSNVKPSKPKKTVYGVDEFKDLPPDM